MLGLFLVPFVSAAQESLEDPTDKLVPFVEFEKTDVRVALSWLFQSVHAHYHFDPGVKGFVTVSLRNVTFEVALQTMVKQVKATYRIEAGDYEILNLYDFDKPVPLLRSRREIDLAYTSFRKEGNLTRFVPAFRLNSGEKTLVGFPAQRQLLNYVHRHPQFKVYSPFRLEGEEGRETKVGAVVQYDLKPEKGCEWFYDVWVRRVKTPWRLLSREPCYAPI